MYNYWRNIESDKLVQELMWANENSADTEHWPVTVIYRDVQGNVWARPAKEFRERYMYVRSSGEELEEMERNLLNNTMSR